MSGPRLGFGCASLGSRIARADGLAALERAYAAGVDWYDVAPSYGDGQAEALLGSFLKGKRDRVAICTKVGILPPAPSLPKRMLRPLVRTALSVAPGLRAQIKKRRPAAIKPPLDAAVILPSLEASLTRLGTDHVDVLALHAATAAEVARDDVIAAVEAVLASGKAKAVSIASSADAVLAGVAASSAYGVGQVANNVFERDLAVVRAGLPAGRALMTVTHTVFGADGVIERLTGRIERDAALAAAFAEAGYGGGARATAIAFLADYAFAANAGGVVLMSMFSGRHLESNLARHALPRDAATIDRLAAMIGAAA